MEIRFCHIFKNAATSLEYTRLERPGRACIYRHGDWEHSSDGLTNYAVVSSSIPKRYILLIEPRATSLVRTSHDVAEILPTPFERIWKESTRRASSRRHNNDLSVHDLFAERSTEMPGSFTTVEDFP